MHERPALLHVAGEAGFVDRRARQLLGVIAVHVVARRAGHLPFDDRVMNRPVDLRALLLVAGEAHLGLSLPVAHRVACSVKLVAVGARDVAAAVRARLPVDAVAALVAGEADTGLFFRRNQL
jgi:hypothetical protein